MSCRTDGKLVGPFISDPYAYAQAKLLCDGVCNVNAQSCVAGYAVADCSIADLVPENFPANI